MNQRPTENTDDRKDFPNIPWEDAILKHERRTYFSNMSYKRLLALAALSLICIMLLLFSFYRLFAYQHKRESGARREASARSAQIADGFSERAEQLASYYITALESEGVNWLVENDIEYSDYSKYTKAYDTLSKNRPDVSGFALINYKTGWTLSNKGLFAVSDIANAKELADRLGSRPSPPKYGWVYVKEPDSIDSKSKNYHFSIDIQGLNLVVGLPLSSFNEYGRLIVNVSPQKCEEWLASWLTDYEDIIILDNDREPIFASDDRMLEECLRMDKEGLSTSDVLHPRDPEGSRACVISCAGPARFLNWRFYIVYDVNKSGPADDDFSEIWYFVNILLLFSSFLAAAAIIYRPVGALVRDIAKNDGSKVEGNELHFLTDKFQNLKKDKSSLEEIVSWQRMHLEELFTLRLLRGEVAETEWNDYMGQLHRIPPKYFLSTVTVLDFFDEGEEQSSLNEEAVCLKLLQDLPKEVKRLAWLSPVCHLGTIFCLLAEDEKEKLRQKSRDFYEGMRTFAEKACGIPVRMGISSPHTSYSHVHSSYRESVNALLTQNIAEGRSPSGHDDKCFYYISDLFPAKEGDGRECRYDFSYEKNVQRSIRSLDRPESHRITDAFFEYLKSMHSSPEQTRICILNYVNAILMEAFQAKTGAAHSYADITGIYHGVLEAMELSKICSDIKQKLLDAILEERMAYINDRSGSIAESVYRLVEQHKGNLTLYECADLLGIDPSYVWKALKLVSSQSFSDITEEYKLEEAKRMLLQTDKKIGDIASLLGYSNTQNFIRFFSRRTGLTPGKFRRLH